MNEVLTLFRAARVSQFSEGKKAQRLKNSVKKKNLIQNMGRLTHTADP